METCTHRGRSLLFGCHIIVLGRASRLAREPRRTILVRGVNGCFRCATIPNGAPFAYQSAPVPKTFTLSFNRLRRAHSIAFQSKPINSSANIVYDTRLFRTRDSSLTCRRILRIEIVIRAQCANTIMMYVAHDWNTRNCTRKLGFPFPLV